MAYSFDFRQQVLKIRHAQDLTIAEASARFGIGIATLTRWNKSCSRKPYTRKKHRKIDPKVLAEDVRLYPDSYQHERAKRLGVVQNAICYALKKLGVTYKKSSQTSQSGRRQTAILPEQAG